MACCHILWSQLGEEKQHCYCVDSGKWKYYMTFKICQTRTLHPAGCASSFHHSLKLCPPLTSSPPRPSTDPIKQHKSARQTAPTSPPTLTLAAIIRGGAVLSPVSSTRPWISQASAGPCRPLSLTMTLLSLPCYTSLTLIRLYAPFCLPWRSGSCSCCPIIQPVTSLLLHQLKLPSLARDLACGLSPLAPVPLLPPAWMDLSSGKVWPHVARLSRIQVISSDRHNRLLHRPAALRGWMEWRNTEE